MSVPPQLRRRTDAVEVVRVSLSREHTNAQLLSAFLRNQQGKLAPHTIYQYGLHVADLVAYFQRPDGSELHASLWTKELLWEYIHYMEANYCRFFNSFGLHGRTSITCRKNVWPSVLPADDALEKHCKSCKLFENSLEAIGTRLNGIQRFVKFLVRAGILPYNFARDIVGEFREDLGTDPRREKRRNPSVEEMVKLVNETPHLRNRAFYAASAKWGFRPNEMFALDRYESFPDFDSGGDLVVIPSTKGRLDKRKGNRVSVVDSELRPIIEQYFAWWEHTVRRKDDGTPRSTKLWLNEHGSPITPGRTDLYSYFFYPDCLRLGLMTEEDKRDSRRRWTAHCQRHFMEKVLMMNNCPDTWSKHLRGDVVKDARGHYFVPTPEQIREKYLEWYPKLGFAPVPQTGFRSLPLTPTPGSKELHASILRAGLDQLRRTKWTKGPVLTARIVELNDEGKEARDLAYVPVRRAVSFLAAYRRMMPRARLATLPEKDVPEHGRTMRKDDVIQLYEAALRALGE